MSLYSTRSVVLICIIQHKTNLSHTFQCSDKRASVTVMFCVTSYGELARIVSFMENSMGFKVV